MRVQIVDPSAYSAPYDRSLCAALARAGADVELVTSRFLYGPVPPADGYRVNEAFYRRHSAEADLVHYQWLTMPGLDWALLPPPALRNGAGGATARPPQVFTFHERPAHGRIGICLL